MFRLVSSEASRFVGEGSSAGALRYAWQMRVTVLYFGLLKDQFGKERDSVRLDEGSTVSVLVLFLEKSASKRSDIWKSLAVAVNCEYARGQRVLRDGDEVALLPPVSGGGAVIES